MIDRYCPTCKETRKLTNRYNNAKVCKKCLFQSMRGLTWRLSGYGYLIKQIPYKAEGTVKRRTIFFHRHIMEKFLGRKLKKHEHVHHKNHIRTDNRIENLELMTHSQHAKAHASSAEGRARRRQTALKMHRERGHKISVLK